MCAQSSYYRFVRLSRPPPTLPKSCAKETAAIKKAAKKQDQKIGKLGACRGESSRGSLLNADEYWLMDAPQGSPSIQRRLARPLRKGRTHNTSRGVRCVLRIQGRSLVTGPKPR